MKTRGADFGSCLADGHSVLTEGALGERLKREYRLRFDDHVAMAGLVYEGRGRAALTALWSEYADIAQRHGLPLLAATPTRRANRERVSASRYDRSIIGDNVSLLRAVQQRSSAEVYVGGLMGCRGDAYRATDVLPVAEARSFHSWQTDLFAVRVPTSSMPASCRRCRRRSAWPRPWATAACRTSSAS